MRSAGTLRSSLTSTYSSALKSHAYSLEQPILRIPEPLEVWITCLSSMVPFKDRVVCITVDDAAHSSGVVRRARGHFGNVKHVVAPSFDFLGRALEEIPEGSTDAVIFCDNAFGYFLETAPQAITAAHRVLRKNGVVCVWGQHEPAIVAPAGAKDAFDRYVDLLNLTCPVTSLGVGESSVSGPVPLSPLGLRVSSIAASHDDVYFPFPSVAKRMFQSSLRLEIPEVVGVLRSGHQYKQAMTPVPIVDRNGVAVDGAMRLRVRGDPLNDLAGLCHNAVRGDGGITLAVNHFVITCDSRPINQAKGQSMLLGGRRKSPRKLSGGVSVGQIAD